MSWRSGFGVFAAKVVQAAAVLDDSTPRPLSANERALLEPIFERSVDLSRVAIREGVRGLVNLSRRAFVVENTLYLPAHYLPLPPAILVHELVHVWQFQNGGHAYIGDSVHAQLVGDGYELARGLAQGRQWNQLNAEQQATLVEEGFAQGCFAGQPLVLGGVDFTPAFRAAIVELRAGRGAGFLR